MPEAEVKHAIDLHLARGGHLTLFLDYDGTLVPIAPTPAEAMPDSGLIALLTRLAERAAIRTVVISGRPLSDLRRMLPVHALILGGLYGVEMQIGERTLMRGAGDGARDRLDHIREGWRKLSAGLQGFLVEDKGQAVALHARWADAEQAGHVLAAARSMAVDLIDDESFRILDGDRYVEIAPRAADKGQTIDWLLSEYPVDNDLPVEFGDDNKDEIGFAVTQRRGGLAIGVGHRYELPNVDARLAGPDEVRQWLQSFTGQA